MPICDHADAYKPGHDCPQSRAFWERVAHRDNPARDPDSEPYADAHRTDFHAGADCDRTCTDDYTGPDLDVDAVIAAATDHTRAGAIRHDYLAAIRDRAHLQPGERYLDAGPD